MTQVSGINIKLISFGHSYGVAKNVDLLYSIRHFPETNVENYQQYDGRHKRIQNELLHLTEYEEIIRTIIEQSNNYIREHQKDCIIVAVGCEQGRHRSVAVIERLAELLGVTYNVEVNHRDLKEQDMIRANKKKEQRIEIEKYNTYDENCSHT